MFKGTFTLFIIFLCLLIKIYIYIYINLVVHHLPPYGFKSITSPSPTCVPFYFALKLEITSMKPIKFVNRECGELKEYKWHNTRTLHRNPSGVKQRKRERERARSSTILHMRSHTASRYHLNYT
jgi:hypothetical protein